MRVRTHLTHPNSNWKTFFSLFSIFYHGFVCTFDLKKRNDPVNNKKWRKRKIWWKILTDIFLFFFFFFGRCTIQISNFRERIWNNNNNKNNNTIFIGNNVPFFLLLEARVDGHHDWINLMKHLNYMTKSNTCSLSHSLSLCVFFHTLFDSFQMQMVGKMCEMFEWAVNERARASALTQALWW